MNGTGPTPSRTSFLGHDLGYLARHAGCSILLIALPVMVGVAMAVYADRKVWAAMQLRRGPNVVGPFGLLQTFADALKLFLKETIIPSGAKYRRLPDRADDHLHPRTDRMGGDPV